jgi:hypothetical protein
VWRGDTWGVGGVRSGRGERWVRRLGWVCQQSDGSENG